MRTPWPVTLEGRFVSLVPLSLELAPDLHGAGEDRGVWRYLPIAAPEHLQDTERWIRMALAARDSGEELPFGIIDRASGRAVGSTRYLDIRPEHEALEIGWTWIAPAHQRTAVNTECKLLLLTHAFETLGASRVQLKTDARNVQSQQAIERLGAVREGVLRKQRRMWDGFKRDTVFYSILDEEWPAVKARLEGFLRK